MKRFWYFSPFHLVLAEFSAHALGWWISSNLLFHLKYTNINVSCQVNLLFPIMWRRPLTQDLMHAFYRILLWSSCIIPSFFFSWIEVNNINVLNQTNSFFLLRWSFCSLPALLFLQDKYHSLWNSLRAYVITLFLWAKLK